MNDTYRNISECITEILIETQKAKLSDDIMYKNEHLITAYDFTAKLMQMLNNEIINTLDRFNRE